MEIEVKLRLASLASHRKLSSVLSPFRTATHHQRNAFFDGSKSELSSQRAILRLRFHEQPGNPKCFVCLKAKSVIANGISRVEEDEEEFDSSVPDDPRRLTAVDSRVLRRVKDEFGVAEFVALGGFRNVRDVYEWKGLKLEVDEVKYDFGTMYEVECESSEPETAKEMIQVLLKENQIEYADSSSSKFAIFMAGKLPS
ncbi:hypothetical protein M569_16702 [Genlisea aurea]|uniref:CYTH domain-containing protein n=1 Tax=Genlisea aurea TaxID=192259 RepID=S8D632_9LAMI|nr:hypothetical protein M569_16702 [Genlisea aurea]